MGDEDEEEELADELAEEAEEEKAQGKKARCEAEDAEAAEDGALAVCVLVRWRVPRDDG